ncbi:MAG: DNA repair protein RadC [Spirochaetales bacterium]|nr:DNA repair protein RadC [Spirochaetales bacterium]
METILQKRIIQELDPTEQPRSRLAVYGAAALSDIELLSLLLGSGMKNRGVLQIAGDLLRQIDSGNGPPELSELTSVKGLGTAKAGAICAAWEFTRRRLKPGFSKINSPSDILPMVRHYADRLQEHFLCLSLNGAHEVIRLRVVSIGLVNRTMVHPREVFADPLQDRAAAVVAAHNHPSGNLEPSTEDREITQRLKKAGSILGITMLDHIIFSKEGYYSFLEEGTL